MAYQVGEARPSARLTEADVLAIRAQHLEGKALAEIAAAFPQCSKPNIHHIINGRRWKYLLPAEPEA